MNNWVNTEDLTSAKTFIELQDFILRKEQDIHNNNESLQKMVIANSVKPINDNARVKALSDGVSQLVDSIQQLQRQHQVLVAKVGEVKAKDKEQENSKTNTMLAQLLVNSNNQCLAAPPQNDKIAELEKQLAEAKKAASSKKNNSTSTKAKKAIYSIYFVFLPRATKCMS